MVMLMYLERVDRLEVAVKGVIMEPKIKPDRLLEVTMRVLAEENRLESLLEKAKTALERQKLEEALKRIKGLKKSLLRVYFSSAILGSFKPEYIPAITALGRRRVWLPLEPRK